MRFLWFALVFLFGIALADVNVPWGNCNENSPMKLDALTANVWPPQSGKPLTLNMHLSTSTVIDGSGTCEIEIRGPLNIKFLSKKLSMKDAFAAMNSTTPIQPGSWVWSDTWNMPKQHVKHLELDLQMKQNSGDLICVKLKAPITLDNEDMDMEIPNLFTTWMKEHGRVYETQEELLHRYQIFSEKYNMFMTENAKGHSYTLGMNQFSDMTSEEVSRMNGFVSERDYDIYSGEYFQYDANKDTPTEVDWRTKGAVTAVKNQGQCGSCWSFSTTGAVEGINAIKSGTLTSFSEQEIVDCDRTFLTKGCMGGSMGFAMRWVKKQGGLCTEADYPYTAKDGQCQKSSCKPAGGAITGFTKVAPNNADALMQAIAQQPVSIAIEADQTSFQHYAGGVFTGPCGQQLDHGVLVVGYGTENGQDYWLVKNSWGAEWGDNGYIKIARGQNLCGITDQPLMPNM